MHVSPDYKFVANPAVWSKSCHKRPCPETDAIDAMLNDLAACTQWLSKERTQYCMAKGKERNRQSRTLRNYRASTKSDDYVHILGVMGEVAVAQYLGIEYEFTVNQFRSADLPFDIEVRTTQRHDNGCKVRPDDQDHFKVVMAITDGPGHPVTLAGWVLAKDGKTFPVMDPGRKDMPFHRVPQDSLRPMAELRAMFHVERVQKQDTVRSV